MGSAISTVGSALGGKDILTNGGKGVSNVLGELTGSNAANRAIEAQTAAANQSNRTLRHMFDTQRADLQPWREAGQGALSDLTANKFMDNWQQDPGYQFRLQEGLKAINAAASAGGRSQGGATLKALTRFGQDYGSNEYGKIYDRNFNRLSSIAGLGSNANAQQTQATGNYGSQVAQNQMGLGNAIGAANIAQGNITSGLLQQAIGGAIAYSDKRLKTNITRLPVSKFKDVPTYEFEYKNQQHGEGRFIGVMAQDLLAIDPIHPAVIQTEVGLAVDYSKLEGAA